MKQAHNDEIPAYERRSESSYVTLPERSRRMAVCEIVRDNVENPARLIDALLDYIDTANSSR